MSSYKNFILYVLVTIVILAFAIGMWQVVRRCHYNISYKSMVEQTIIEMVREEALKSSSIDKAEEKH